MTRINLAETLTALGKNGEAEQALRHVLEREPHHAKAKAALGRVLVAEGRASEAVPYLEAAAQGKEPGALLDLAGAYLRLGEAAKAEAAGRALARSPGDPWALALAGHALVLEGRHQEGLALLQRALAIGPRRAEVCARSAPPSRPPATRGVPSDVIGRRNPRLRVEATPLEAPLQAPSSERNMTNASTKPSVRCRKAPGSVPTIRKPSRSHNLLAVWLVETTTLNCMAR